jgi:hypothetical protein
VALELIYLTYVLAVIEHATNAHRPHRTLDQAAPVRPLPPDVTDLDSFRVRRLDRAGGLLHEYHQVA